MRRDNWESALIGALDIAERQPHVYGESDCLMKAAWNAAVVLHDDDPRRADILAMIERYRGRYSSLTGAYRVLREDGLTPLRSVSRFFQAIPVVRAGGGDIGAVRNGRHLAFGTFLGPYLYVSVEQGNGILPRSAAVMAFEVD